MAQTFGPNLLPRLIAEAVGTFALLYVGVAVLIQGPGPGLVGVALAHGLTIAVMASAVMTVSGAHFNPAVTVAIWVGKKINTPDALAYIAVQLASGTLGALLAKASFEAESIAAGVPAVADGVSTGTAILIEAVITFLLVFVIYGTGVDPRFAGRVGGLAIGLTISANILAVGALTGAAMNPARWFGAALADGDLSGAMVYIVGPLIGGILAGWLYSAFILERPTPHPPGEPSAPLTSAR